MNRTATLSLLLRRRSSSIRLHQLSTATLQNQIGPTSEHATSPTSTRYLSKARKISSGIAPSLGFQNPNSNSVRYLATSNRKKKKRNINPFKVLNVSRQTDYSTVKKAFLKVAMAHHPDVAGSKTKEEQDKSRDIFIKHRQAFEALAPNPEGGICLVEELPDYEPDEEHNQMDTWFKQETGFDMPFMDEETMREVADATETMDIGLDRDGGMWALAKMVKRTVRDGGSGDDLLRIESGQVPDEINDVNLRARRRRKMR